MNSFLNANKNLLTYTLLFLIIIPFFGINFLLSLIGNIFLLLFLIPVLLLLLVFLGFNFYNTKLNTCNNCGTVALGFSDNCMNCGANLNNMINENQKSKKPSESTIEVQAEEIK